MPEVALQRRKLWIAEHRDSLSHYPPLLLIHGAGGSHLDWPAELRRLPGITVLVPDLPGHGRSPGPGRQTVSAYAADMVALLDALHIRRAIVGGHSMGGAIAQVMALNYPERVAGLILIGTGAKLRVHPDILARVRNEPDAIYELLTTWMWAEDVPEQVRRLGRRRIAANDPQVVYGDYLACNTFDVMTQIQRIAAPTLVIGGTADRMTPHKFSAYLAEHIPRAELVTIEGGGHMMALEQPQAVAQAVAAWLERTTFEK